MSTLNNLPVLPENLLKLRQKMAELNSIIEEMREAQGGWWIYWEDCFSYDCLIDRFQVCQTLLAAFNNTYEPTCPTRDVIVHELHKFTSLTRTLNRSFNVLGLEAITNHEYDEDYQIFLKLFGKFYEIADSLHDGIGE